MPKSVPCLVLDKVRQVLVSEVLNFDVLFQNVPNKSLIYAPLSLAPKSFSKKSLMTTDR